MNAPARNPYAAYQKNEVNGLNPGEIVCRLYQKLHSKLRVAQEAIKREQTTARGESLSLALAIIGELQASLNMEQGGEIAANLNDLYSFLTMELVMAGLHNDADRVTKAIKIVEPLVEAWEQIVKKERSSGIAETPQPEASRPQFFHAVLG
jgi:flagellar secretion chaperone FliS